MKVLKILIISLSVCSLCLVAYLSIPSDILSKEPTTLKPTEPAELKQTKLDCTWECDVKKKECVCNGKNCETCTGEKAPRTKARGGMGLAAIKVAVEACTENCFWICAGSIDGECIEWEQKCVTVCRKY